MNWNNVLNAVQFTFYIAGIIVLILLGVYIVNSQAQMERAHERIMSSSERTLQELICK